MCVDAGQYGLNISAENYVGSGTRLLRTTDISNGTLTPPEEGVHVAGPVEGRFALRPGDLLLSRSGTPPGQSYLVGEADAGATFAGYLVRFRPRPDVEPRFLGYVARSAAFQHKIRAESVASTIQNFNAERYANMAFEAPDLRTQRRIADFLDVETGRLDALRASREKQVALLEERLSSAWSAAVDEDGGEASWVPLRRFITAITDGPFGSSLTSSHYADHGARVIRLGNVGRAEFRDRDAAYIPMEYFAQLTRHTARAGDLIVAGLGDQNHPLGRACVVPEGMGPAMVKADCFRLRLDRTRLLHDYAAWALSSPPVADQVTLLARGSTRARINLEVVRDIPLPVPSLARQRRTIAILTEARSATRAVTDRCRRQLDLITERRQALITAAVTGRFDVSTAGGRNVTDGVTV
ncbi:hypothetical protein AMK26_15620 [Streptomyces sp. CB03234]|nr:hypothetical protein AMK26_15620 [Streptomyces sp. CB03234]